MPYNTNGTELSINLDSYDAAGNLLNDKTHNYFYDAENRIIQVDGTLGNCSTATACYTYDAFDRRVGRTGYTDSTCFPNHQIEYVYDLSNHPMLELNSNGTACGGEFFVGNRHLASTRGGTLFSHRDWVGTERLRIQSVYVSIRNYDQRCTSLPFGDGMSPCDGSYSSPIHFTGKERDTETGLDNFGARYDASSLGRFMTPDPLGGSIANPQTLNKYSYVANNPINFTDPTGLYMCKDSKDCSSAADVKFEKALDALRNSSDSDVARAAAAYGGVNSDNGVKVGFADLSTKGENGSTVSTVGYSNGELRANSDVTINSKINGDSYAAAIGHEGSHAADAQDVVKSGLTQDSEHIYAGMDITHYQSEVRAWGVSQSILKSGNFTHAFDCGTGILTKDERP